MGVSESIKQGSDMHQPLSRRDFVDFGTRACVAGVVGGAWSATALAAEGTAQPAPAREKPKRPPALESELVREFVAAAHSDLPKTKLMLEKQPRLINATWDWSEGDFETALGGASHMGRPDIANYLLAHGARLDIFAAAMLGQLEIVKAAVTSYPDIVRVPGPHGIPLIKHAEAGGSGSNQVLIFLKSLG